MKNKSTKLIPLMAILAMTTITSQVEAGQKLITKEPLSIIVTPNCDCHCEGFDTNTWESFSYDLEDIACSDESIFENSSHDDDGITISCQCESDGFQTITPAIPYDSDNSQN